MLRLIDEGALLVSDDQTIIEAADGQLHASPPATIAGKLEVRGHGIVALEYVPIQRLDLIVDLADAGTVERMPEPSELTETLCGCQLDRVFADASRADATARIRLALKLSTTRPANVFDPLV
ncbi:MAG: hypothetical protein HKN60_08675 [Rhizobiales bacterium]|nr:hypothetical protein [Hyphomicrobiales bacterium]